MLVRVGSMMAGKIKAIVSTVFGLTDDDTTTRLLDDDGSTLLRDD